MQSLMQSLLYMKQRMRTPNIESHKRYCKRYDGIFPISSKQRGKETEEKHGPGEAYGSFSKFSIVWIFKRDCTVRHCLSSNAACRAVRQNPSSTESILPPVPDASLNERPAAARSVAAGRGDQISIRPRSFFMAFFSIWRIRSADTPYSSASSWRVAFSSASHRRVTMVRLRSSRVSRAS